MTNVSIKADSNLLFSLYAKNIVIIAIREGNLPLQGTNEFVKIATNLSLFESIILVLVTPTALHPNPIHILSDCLPHELHL